MWRKKKDQSAILPAARHLSNTNDNAFKMWYDILPSAIIIVAAMAFPTYATYYMNWFVLGHSYRRALETRSQKLLYLRDVDRFGSTYAFVGLDEFFAQTGAGSEKECVCEEDK